MLIGYARVSTADQTLNLQQDALEQAGCSKIFTDTISGAKTERVGLKQALSYVRPGDTLVVWRLDRLYDVPQKSDKKWRRFKVDCQHA
jgi:DNA invertase Pin-like site-specific DNA recombinase